LAGILKGEFRQVAGEYEAADWRLVAARTGGEWRSAAFERADMGFR